MTSKESKRHHVSSAIFSLVESGNQQKSLQRESGRLRSYIKSTEKYFYKGTYELIYEDFVLLLSCLFSLMTCVSFFDVDLISFFASPYLVSKNKAIDD